MTTLSLSKQLLLAGALLFPLDTLAACDTLDTLEGPLHHQRADEIDALIRRGRAYLDSSEPDKALILFEQADGETRGELRTRMWVLRAWMDLGRINDAFDHLEEKYTNKGVKGPDIDYLYGMGSYAKAQGMIRDNVPSSTTGFAFQDAMTFLTAATEADGKKYYDAFLPLADSAWNSQKLEVASKAVDKAVDLNPKDANTRFLKARIRLSRFVVANADDRMKEAAEEHLATCIASLTEAAQLVPDAKQDPILASAIHKQLGDAYLWKADQAKAAEAYARAMGLEPSSVDFTTLFGQLSNAEGCKPFVECLTSGAKQFEEHYGARTNRDATLLWWLGYARQTNGEYEAAEAAFTKSVAKWPAYTNAHFYTGMSRYYRKDYDGMVAALRKNWEAAPADLVSSISADKKLHLDVLEFVIGQFAKRATEEGDGAANESAAFLCEVRVGAQPESWLFWDNLGLFSRDAGIFVADRGEGQDAERAQRYYERSFEAYKKAIEIAPDKPHLKNDGAVLLHYYLDRDLLEARAMYESALIQATELLAAGGLDDVSRELAETAKRDSKTNLARLEEKLK